MGGTTGFMKDWFNILLFGMQTPRKDAMERLKEMKHAALKMTTACGWSDNVGLFFVIYGHTECTSPLQIVDMDYVGPSYEALQFKLLRLEDALAGLQACNEVIASSSSGQTQCLAESRPLPLPCSSDAVDAAVDAVEQQGQLK